MYTVEINDGEVTSALQRLADGLTDMTPAMQDIVEFMVDTTKKRFPTGIAPDGSPWAPKSPVTTAAYKRRGDRVDPRPLFGPSSALSQQIHGAATGQSAEWGSSMIYAAVMQFGAAQGQFGAFIGRDKLGRDHFHHLPWGDIPARPFIGMSETDSAGIVEIVGEYLERLL